eukprot:6484230-Amphidinium_carterae.1
MVGSLPSIQSPTHLAVIMRCKLQPAVQLFLDVVYMLAEICSLKQPLVLNPLASRTCAGNNGVSQSGCCAYFCASHMCGGAVALIRTPQHWTQVTGINMRPCLAAHAIRVCGAATLGVTLLIQSSARPAVTTAYDVHLKEANHACCYCVAVVTIGLGFLPR